MLRRLPGLMRRRRGVRSEWRDAPDLLVLTGPETGEDALERLGLPADAEVQRLDEPVGRPRERDAVALVVTDLVGLRRAVTGMPHVGSARRVAVLFERPVTRLPGPVGHPQWPVVEQLEVRRTPDPRLVISFAGPATVRPVLLQVAAAAALSGSLAVGWPALGARRQVPAQWPPADPSAFVAVLPRLLDQTLDFPPDLVLTGPEAADRDDFPESDHKVLGRPSRVAVVEPDLRWDQWDALSPTEAAATLAARGATSLGPVDEHVVNPIGFTRDAERPAVSLAGDRGSALTVPVGGDRAVQLDPGGRVSDVDLPALRSLTGVTLDWRGGHGPQAYCRAVTGLAAAGVPLVTEAVPGWAQELLAPELVAALDRPADLDDRLDREEHSVRLRRAALHGHGTGPWRRALAVRHGLQQAEPPRVTVLLATRRPEMLEFALRQVTRQRGADLEVVLATHGFEPEPGTVERLRATMPMPLTVLPVSSSVPFGEVLNRAAACASGDRLLKMDDDDWYGPDFVADLLLAQHYSGAALVGCAAEFTYLAEIDLTTRGAQASEVYRHAVAGGTMLADRSFFRHVGGFRHTARYVDASLLTAAARSGAATYRTHGLGYVLRRATTGHTWDPGLGFFLKAERAVDQWRGFRPSVLLEPDAGDRPTGRADTLTR